MPDEERWKATWCGLGVQPDALLSRRFDELIARYSEPHRRYHTCRHLDECLERLAELRSEATRPFEVELALWYHDAIYEPRSSTNEADSARLAATVMREAGVTGDGIVRVGDLILATRHAAVPQGPDEIVMVDVDLSILGAPAARFDEYEMQIREEYSWLPVTVFERERRKILGEFLARSFIFASGLFRTRYEAQARENLQRSIRRLGG